MNFAQLIDPERAVAEAAPRSGGAPPSTRVHVRPQAVDPRRKAPGSARRPAQDFGITRRVLCALIALGKPATTPDLAKALCISTGKARSAISQLEATQRVLCVGPAQRPMHYEPTLKGRDECA